MKTVSEVYPSMWLSPADLKGMKVAVTISEVAVEELRNATGGKQPKIILTFHGKTKRMALNVTQARSVAQLTGTEEFEAWAGHSVALFATETPNGHSTIGIVAA